MFDHKFIRNIYDPVDDEPMMSHVLILFIHVNSY